jgi:uncharacterized cupredoxin-like copper-binding protein
MAAYYAIGIALVVWAFVLTAAGVTREGFPPTRQVARGLMGVSGVLVVGAIVALISTTHKEHPREDAKAEAAKKAAEGKVTSPGQATGQLQHGGATVSVSEKEYSVKLSGSTTLKAGKYTIVVANEGKIQHDLAIEGPGVKKPITTPLIDPKKGATLKVDLPPGKYKFYCTVPGHEQLGMKTEVTVQ